MTETGGEDYGWSETTQEGGNGSPWIGREKKNVRMRSKYGVVSVR